MSEDIEKFASNLKTTGEKYGVGAMIDFGEGLLVSIENFDLEDIEKSLKYYPDMVGKIKEALIPDKG